MDNGFVVFAIALAAFSLGFSICNLMWNHESDKIANSPELLSGTTWQGGECVLVLNQK